MAAKARILVGSAGQGVMMSGNDGERQSHCFRHKLARPGMPKSLTAAQFDAKPSSEARQLEAGYISSTGWICFDTCRSHISGV